MRLRTPVLLALVAALFAATPACLLAAEVTAHLAHSAPRPPEKPPASVIWLKPVQQDAERPGPGIAPGRFTLVQKNKTFVPHLLVVPLGSSVAFPNTDPFFHNVFSLFDGKRFDLGLYEAGSTRTVQFSREGVSYIFCNIHSEMSAVIVTLNTPFYAIADAKGDFRLPAVPPGDYNLYIWIEGQRQSALDRETRRVHIGSEGADLGEIRSNQPESEPHLNKYGRPYDAETHPVY
jgi:plastocyanin